MKSQSFYVNIRDVRYKTGTTTVVARGHRHTPVGHPGTVRLFATEPHRPQTACLRLSCTMHLALVLISKLQVAKRSLVRLLSRYTNATNVCSSTGLTATHHVGRRPYINRSLLLIIRHCVVQQVTQLRAWTQSQMIRVAIGAEMNDILR